MPGRRLRMGLPKRRLTVREPLEDVATGVGLTGIYAVLALTTPLLAERLAPVVSLYASGIALAYSWWLHKYHRATRHKWARAASLTLLAVVAGKPLAAWLHLAPYYQTLLDGLLFLTASLTLHQASKNPQLPPHTALQLDRLGGLAFLGAFATLIPLPLIALTALVIVAASLLRGYTILAAIARASKIHTTTRETPIDPQTNNTKP